MDCPIEVLLCKLVTLGLSPFSRPFVFVARYLNWTLSHKSKLVDLVADFRRQFFEVEEIFGGSFSICLNVSEECSGRAWMVRKELVKLGSLYSILSASEMSR